MSLKPNWKSRFIDAFRNSGNVRASCQAAGISRAVCYRERDKNPAFKAAWDESLQDAVDTLEATAWQRARTGLSDQVLMMLLRAHRPNLYRERMHIEVTREQDIEVVMRARNLTRDEAELAVAEAERVLAGS